MPDVAPTGTGSDSASSLGGISLEDGIADLLGDGGFGTDEGESPAGETSTDAAGAPPAERQETPAEGQPAPEGTVPAERAGTPPADAALPAPDVPPAPEADPLASATPFTYTVNGEARPFDGIKVLGEHGAIVEPKALELLQRRLGERDHLFETNREQYAKVQDFERLSAWHTTDAQGNAQVLSGREGLETMRTQHAMLAASFDTLASVFTDPAKFAALVDVDPQTGQIIPNQQALQHLLTESDLAESRAEKAIRTELQKLVTSAATAPSSPAPDFTAHAPAVITQAAGSLVSHLTAEDRQTLAQQMPRYVRAVTEADRRDNATLRLGSPIVDASFTQIVTALATVRSQAKAAVTATTSASAENAKKLAAAALGRPSVAPARQQTASVTPVDTSRESDADKAWKLRERMAGGRFSS